MDLSETREINDFNWVVGCHQFTTALFVNDFPLGHVYYQWQKLVAKSIIEQLTLQICIYVLNPKPITPTTHA